MNKQSSIPDFDSVQDLAKMAAEGQALALAKNSLLGAGLGTGLGYLKHRIGEYLSPSGSEHAPKLRSLQRQLGKPGKDQTQVKQQIARIQEQQDEARRSSRNRNLLGGAVAGGSLGAYLEHVKQTDKNTARLDRKALQEQAFKSEQKAKATQEAKAKKDRDAAAWERSYKAKQETDAVLRELSEPGNSSTPSARSQKWFEQNNTSTPEPVKAVEDKEKEIAATIAANEKRYKKDHLDEMAYQEHKNSLIRNSMKRHQKGNAWDVFLHPIYTDDSLILKGLGSMYGLEPGMLPSESERSRTLLDNLYQTNEEVAIPRVLKERVSSMNKKSSIQGLAKMAADEHGLSLAEGGLLGAGLGTGLGYLKHRVGEYLSPSGSESAPKLQALQKQLGKPGKDQTQIKQQIAKIQKQQDEARRSSRNRNLLGGAAAGGSLGAYFTQRSRDQNEFRENTNRANRQRSADAQAKENYDKVLRDRKFDAEAEAEKQFKARREADSKNSTLPAPARTSTPSELSRKRLEETNTPTPSKTPEPVKVVEDEIKTLNEDRLYDHRPYRDYFGVVPMKMPTDKAELTELREQSLKPWTGDMENDYGIDSVKSDSNDMQKALAFEQAFPEGTPESIKKIPWDYAFKKLRKKQKERGALIDFNLLNDPVVRKNMKERVSSMNKKSSIQDLAKMAACGDACRCGQTENECTGSDVEKLARLVAKQAGVFMKNMKEPNPIEVRTTDRGFMPVAEHYREPRLLAKPFYNQRREFQNALELLAIMQPEVMDREQPNSNDASQFGITLAMRYPDRYRLPADARAELDGPEPKKAPRQKKANSCSCGCDNENECTCSDVEKLARLVAKQASSGAWTRAEGKSESGGLNAKGRASLKAQGQNIKPPVTEAKPTGERAGRKSSFCARMGGMKKKLTSSETANDPDSRINKALRKWRC